MKFEDDRVRDLTDSLYKPLISQQYRILKILPGAAQSPLRCRLLRATLTSIDGARLDDENDQDCMVEYDALSYSWGWPARTCSVYCNDVQFPITPHLKNALWNVRLPDQAVYVWTDAFCINQFDLAEKGEQVQLMFTIFRKARKVIGWLGSSKDPSREAHLSASLHFLSIEGVLGSHSPFTLFHNHRWVPDSTCKRILSKLESYASEAVQRNQWFARTWIRQEVFAAKRVEMRHGAYHFDLWTLARLVMPTDSGRGRPELQLFESLMERYGSHSVSSSHIDDTRQRIVLAWLDLVLSNAQGFNVSEPQDRIFALQNMAQPDDARHRLLFPIIDYSIPNDRLYEDFIKQLVFQHNTLAPLGIFEDRRRFQNCSLPSWVPDWRESKTRLANIDPKHFRLHEPYRLDITKPGVLSLEGVKLGIVGDRLSSYEESLSVSMSRAPTRSFALALYRIYRSKNSVLTDHRPFNQVPDLLRGLEEISYKACDYATEIFILDRQKRYPYVLVSAAVRPGDLLVSFTRDSAILTTSGYERSTWCSVIRRCDQELGKYYFLGPCIFDHLDWFEPDAAAWRWAPWAGEIPESTERYALI